MPPLHYDWVYKLKQQRPELEIVINGGIDNLIACQQHLDHVDGVMIGRAAYKNPYLLNNVDQQFFAVDPLKKDCGAERDEILLAYLPYIEQQLSTGVSLGHMTRHILGLYQKVPGAKIFRRHISENANLPGADSRVVIDALNLVKNARRETELIAQSLKE